MSGSTERNADPKLSAGPVGFEPTTSGSAGLTSDDDRPFANPGDGQVILLNNRLSGIRKFDHFPLSIQTNLESI